MLSTQGFARAANFLHRARPLEKSLFAFHFEKGPAAAALKELQAFQNADGGFQGLEPDIGFSLSSTVATCSALHILHELETPTEHPVAQRALDFLIGTYDPKLEGWPIIPPHDNTQPHAPWWRHAENPTAKPDRFHDNPRPDVLAGLYFFACAKTDNLRDVVSRATIAQLNSAQAVEMHGLVCYTRLNLAPGLPADLKQALDRRLPAWIDQGVERDSAKWGGYELRPLDIAPRDDSPWRAQLGTSVDDNLDYLITRQADDGSWLPYWSWGNSFPEAWPAAKLKWQAFLTLRELRSLRSYRRLSP